MDEKLREQLLKLIEKYKMQVKDDGRLTWGGFPDKRGLGQIKMHEEEIISLLKEQ